jgi:hypothetical protein
MMGKRHYHIQYNFTQAYSSWPTTSERTSTLDILEKLDTLEKEVYKDREFQLANEMIEDARSCKH